MSTIQINPSATIRREPISEEHCCVIVDDFLLEPKKLIDFAVRHAGDFDSVQSSYPGPLLRIDASAMADIYRFIRFSMARQFPFHKGGLDFWSYLAIVAVRPSDLSYLQRICHTDPERNPRRAPYAALIYLFENEDLGGTGFYRWKELEIVKQIEAVGREDPDKALALLHEHFPTYRRPSHYMTESNEIAELLTTIPARFNRMIFYSGDVPHSGAITSPELLSRDVQQGRLTLNVFVSAIPQQPDRRQHESVE